MIKKSIQKELNEIKTQQGNKLVELQQQFKSSDNNVEEILNIYDKINEIQNDIMDQVQIKFLDKILLNFDQFQGL